MILKRICIKHLKKTFYENIVGGKSHPTPPIPDNGKTKCGVSIPTGGKNGSASK